MTKCILCDAQAQDTIANLKSVCYSQFEEADDIQKVGAQTVSALDSSIEAMQYTAQKLKKQFDVSSVPALIRVKFYVQ